MVCGEASMTSSVVPATNHLDGSDLIRNGDTVVIQLDTKKQMALTVRDGEVLQTTFGALPHSYLIGRPYGCKVLTMNSRGYVHALRLTPELWTINLTHRTQVLYSHDISFIVLMLQLQPGKVAVESGTGSGSLSHALIRAVKPTGHLFTYEFHAARAKTARKEFDNHGIGDHVTVTFNDVLKNGYYLEDVADAVVLDLPMSEKAIVHAKKVLKKEYGRLCSFSPCIEQAQQTCTALHAEGFYDIQTYECLSKELQPTTVYLAEPNFSCSRRLVSRPPVTKTDGQASASMEATEGESPAAATTTSSSGDGDTTAAESFPEIVSTGAAADVDRDAERTSEVADGGNGGTPCKRSHESDDLPAAKRLASGSPVESSPSAAAAVMDSSGSSDVSAADATASQNQSSSGDGNRPSSTASAECSSQPEADASAGRCKDTRPLRLELSALHLIENPSKAASKQTSGSHDGGTERGSGASRRPRSRGGFHGKARSRAEGDAVSNTDDKESTEPATSPVAATPSTTADTTARVNTATIGHSTPNLSAVCRTALSAGRVPGHTGYLTFATLRKG